MRFKFKVADNFFPDAYEGEISADNREEAIQDLKEDYAQELGTTEEQIVIIELVEIK